MEGVNKEYSTAWMMESWESEEKGWRLYEERKVRARREEVYCYYKCQTCENRPIITTRHTTQHNTHISWSDLSLSVYVCVCVWVMTLLLPVNSIVPSIYLVCSDNDLWDSLLCLFHISSSAPAPTKDGFFVSSPSLHYLFTITTFSPFFRWSPLNFSWYFPLISLFWPTPIPAFVSLSLFHFPCVTLAPHILILSIIMWLRIEKLNLTFYDPIRSFHHIVEAVA